MVVEQDSRDIGVPSVPSFPVKADHIGICKFANRDDRHFQRGAGVSEEGVHAVMPTADIDAEGLPP